MANQPISVHVDNQSLYNVRTMLSGLADAVPKITQMAVNKAISGVKTDATNEVAAVITATKTKIREAITTRKMTSKNSHAYVRCEGKPLGLIHFGARQTKKGVTVKVLRSEPRGLIKHAYIATMKSGHKGVFWRDWTGTRRPVKPGRAYGALPRKYRLPMSERYSLAVPNVLGYPPTIRAVLDLAGPRLEKEMATALKYYMSKL